MPGYLTPSIDEILYDLDAGTSPDTIVTRGWLNKVHGQLLVGKAMYERSKVARRKMNRMRNDPTVETQVHIDAIHDYYKKKDKWKYWGKKWGLTHTAKPIELVV